MCISNVARFFLALTAAFLVSVTCYEVRFGNGGRENQGIAIAGNIKAIGSDFFPLTENVSYGSGLLRATEKAEDVKSWTAKIDCTFGALNNRRYLRGLAFWCTKDPSPSLPANDAKLAFGLPVQWNGLAVFVEPRENSKISIKAVWNNGTTVYNPVAQPQVNYHFASSERSIGNDGRFSLQIEYDGSNFTVYLGQGELCFRREKLNLSGYGWFALSGAVDASRPIQPIGIFSFSVDAKSIAVQGDKAREQGQDTHWQQPYNTHNRSYQQSGSDQLSGKFGSDQLSVKMSEQFEEMKAKLGHLEGKMSSSFDSIFGVVGQLRGAMTDSMTRAVGDTVGRAIRDEMGGSRRIINDVSHMLIKMEERMTQLQHTVVTMQRESKLDALQAAKGTRWMYASIFLSTILIIGAMVRVSGWHFGKGAMGEAPKKFI